MAFAEEAGFCKVDLELHLSAHRAESIKWETWLSVRPNPLAPSLNEVLERNLTPKERLEFETHFRPLV